MNQQQRSDQRSLTLHKEIARKLRNDPIIWQIPLNNIANWKGRRGQLPPALLEWEQILGTLSRDQILEILESDTEEASRLRSSSPFAGILTVRERADILHPTASRHSGDAREISCRSRLSATGNSMLEPLNGTG